MRFLMHNVIVLSGTFVIAALGIIYGSDSNAQVLECFKYGNIEVIPQNFYLNFNSVTTYFYGMFGTWNTVFYK
jgi:hypothetical protein